MRQVAEVYFNGKFPGLHKTGFTPFGFDSLLTSSSAVARSRRHGRQPLHEGSSRSANGGRDRKSGPGALSSAANPNLAPLHAEIKKTIPEQLNTSRPAPFENPVSYQLSPNSHHPRWEWLILTMFLNWTQTVSSRPINFQH